MVLLKYMDFECHCSAKKPSITKLTCLFLTHCSAFVYVPLHVLIIECNRSLVLLDPSQYDALTFLTAHGSLDPKFYLHSRKLSEEKSFWKTRFFCGKLKACKGLGILWRNNCLEWNQYWEVIHGEALSYLEARMHASHPAPPLLGLAGFNTIV